MTRYAHKVRYSGQVLIHRFHAPQDPGLGSQKTQNYGMLQIVDEDPDKAGGVTDLGSSAC